MIATDTAETATPIEWLSPHQIRGIVDRALEDPVSKLKPGVHYVRLQGRVKPRYKVSAKILEVV
jgi:hypothetical protein